jgi:ferritin-like metal-binding protein YciE
MASVGSLREHLVEELNDLLNAEQQLIEALPQMADKASTRELKAAFKSHLAQTRTHERRAAQALKRLGESASGKTCEAMEGLLDEGEQLMSSAGGGALLDAMLITAAQKVEHYEIATYGTVRTYAKLLGEPQVAKLLEQTLKEEKQADRKLTGIAEASVNKRAAKEFHEQSSVLESGSAVLQKGAAMVGSTVGAAMRRLSRGQVADRSARRSRSNRSRRGTARKAR